MWYNRPLSRALLHYPLDRSVPFASLSGIDCKRQVMDSSLTGSTAETSRLGSFHIFAQPSEGAPPDSLPLRDCGPPGRFLPRCMPATAEPDELPMMDNPTSIVSNGVVSNFAWRVEEGLPMSRVVRASESLSEAWLATCRPCKRAF